MEKYKAQILFVIGLAVWLGWMLLGRVMAVDPLNPPPKADTTC